MCTFIMQPTVKQVFTCRSGQYQFGGQDSCISDKHLKSFLFLLSSKKDKNKADNNHAVACHSDYLLGGNRRKRELGGGGH